MRVSINQERVSFRIWRSVLALPGTGSRTFLIMPTNVTAGTMLHPSCGLGGLPLQDPSPHMAVGLAKQATSFSGFLECRSETDIWRNLTAVTSGHLLFCVCVCVVFFFYVRLHMFRGQKHGGRAKHCSFGVTRWELWAGAGCGVL